MKNEYLKVHYLNTGDEEELATLGAVGMHEWESINFEEDIRDLLREKLGHGEFECIIHGKYEYVRYNDPLDPEEWDVELVSLTVIDSERLDEGLNAKEPAPVYMEVL